MSEISEERKKEIRQSEDYKKARKILIPLYSNITMTREEFDLTERPPFWRRDIYHPNFADFRNNCHKFEKTWEEANKVSKILKDLKIARQPTPKHESMSKMLSYLGLVESLGIAFVDAIHLLLMANERAIHTKGALTKHVTKVRELEKVDLAYKLEFLEDEGFEIFKKLINKDTRNHIAHLKFTIEENGEIRKRDNSPIHIDEDVRNFWYGVDVLRVVFEDVGLLSWFTGENLYSIKNEIAEEKENEG